MFTSKEHMMRVLRDYLYGDDKQEKVRYLAGDINLGWSLNYPVDSIKYILCQNTTSDLVIFSLYFQWLVVKKNIREWYPDPGDSREPYLMVGGKTSSAYLSFMKKYFLEQDREVFEEFLSDMQELITDEVFDKIFRHDRDLCRENGIDDFIPPFNLRKEPSGLTYFLLPLNRWNSLNRYTTKGDIFRDLEERFFKGPLHGVEERRFSGAEAEVTIIYIDTICGGSRNYIESGLGSVHRGFINPLYDYYMIARIASCMLNLNYRWNTEVDNTFGCRPLHIRKTGEMNMDSYLVGYSTVMNYSTDVIRELGWVPESTKEHKLLFGMEYELEFKQSANFNRELLKEILKSLWDERSKNPAYGIFKSDSSIRNGCELVSLPMSPSDLRKRLKNFFDNPTISSSLNSGTAHGGGIHIHVSLDAFSNNKESCTYTTPTLHLKKFIHFLNCRTNFGFNYFISERNNTEEISQWTDTYPTSKYNSYKNSFQQLELTRQSRHRMTNFKGGPNAKTVEVRLFKAINKKESVLKCIDYVAALYDYCAVAPWPKLEYKYFLDWLSNDTPKNKYFYLKLFIKNKRVKFNKMDALYPGLKKQDVVISKVLNGVELDSEEEKIAMMLMVDDYDTGRHVKLSEVGYKKEYDYTTGKVVNNKHKVSKVLIKGSNFISAYGPIAI